MQHPAAIEQKVCGLDVAVDDPGAVGVIERGPGLPKPADRLLAADVIEPDRVADRAAGQKLHDDEGATGCAILTAEDVDVIDRDDVRMGADPGGRAGLALEPADRFLIVSEALGEHLDRDAAVKLEVLGAPHRGHSAVGEMAPDPIAIG